jgi:hypothetical protein
VSGYRSIISTLYEAEAFYERAFHSLLYWKVRKNQHAPQLTVTYKLGTFVRSLWIQGVRSSYRRAYWNFLVRLLSLWGRDPVKLWWGFTILCSGHHFFNYTRTLFSQLDRELEKAEAGNPSREAYVPSGTSL